MAQRSRVASFRGRSTVRRQTGWGLGPSTGGTPPSSQAISASGTTIASIGVVPGVEGLTLVRTRGYMALALESVGAVGDGMDGAFGIAITDDEAFTAGAASVPDPQDDPGSEVWFYHQWFTLSSLQTTQAVVGGDNMSSLRVDIDSKAMRKLPVGKTLYAVLGVIEVGGVSMAWTFGCRLLFKLP